MTKSHIALLVLGTTMLLGSVAGIFQLYSHTIMQGLQKTDNRTFVGAFQAIDRAIINPLFMGAFFGSLILATLACVVMLKSTPLHQAGLFMAAAAGLYLVVVIITLAINVPLNDAIKAAGNPDQIKDLAKVRENFHADTWTLWNNVRVILSTVAFGLSSWCLFLIGRVSD